MSVINQSQALKDRQALFAFTNGVLTDVRLASEEVAVQKAWVDALVDAKMFSSDEALKTHAALDEALMLMRSGDFPWRIEDEDIHMNLERFITQKLGETGKRVHLGRSRNDLIATTLRLFVNHSLVHIKTSLKNLILIIAQKSENLMDILVPGMTHMQHGQPIRFGHILAGHGWAFARDWQKLTLAEQLCLAYMPLGSAALSGTSIPISLENLASTLGFASPPLNSYDAVSDRDFLLDSLHGFSMIGIHMSRLAEDFVNWSSTPNGLVILPPAWSTGSSIMPNKRNPDVPELIRAKSAHLISAANQSQVLMKGLPTSYNSDLHELKSVFMRAFDECSSCLEILGSFIAEIQIDKDRAHSLLKQGHLLATEIANTMTLAGSSFREAYEKTAAMVQNAQVQGVSVESLHHSHLTYEMAVEARKLLGGTSLSSALNGIAKLKALVKD